VLKRDRQPPKSKLMLLWRRN